MRGEMAIQIDLLLCKDLREAAWAGLMGRKRGCGSAVVCTPETRGMGQVVSCIFQCGFPPQTRLLFPQVEMFLLAYAVRHTIQVYRLSKYSTEEFLTVYPTDPPRDWPVVTLIAEDDRHYNIPVRVCEETSL